MSDQLSAQPSQPQTPEVPVPASEHVPAQPELAHTQELKKLDALVIEADKKKQPNLINKPFWRNIFFVLIILPLLTGLGMFAYQQYVDFSLRNSVQTQPVTKIDPSKVVTPELLPTVAVVPEKQQSNANWNQYQNDAGYMIRYPSEVKMMVIEPSSLSASPSAATRIEFFPLTQDATESSVLRLTVFDTQPQPAASAGGQLVQTSTRDIGTHEFKIYEAPKQLNMIGQLGTGKWLSILLNYNSDIAVRTTFTQMIDTIVTIEPEQKP